MSTWIQSLKKYHEEKGTKYKIPKKGSEEHTAILKYHNDTKGKVVVSEPKPVVEKKVRVKNVKPIEPVVATEKVKVVKVKKPRVKKEKVVEDVVEVELVQEE